MKSPRLLDNYHISKVKKLIPVKYIEIESTSRDGDGHKYFIKTAIEYSDSDYKGFISRNSNGLTEIGQKLLQESIESYVYSVVGAQARSHWSIVNKGAKSTQTQDIFRKIVGDTIIQSDVTVTIANMREAIKACNVVLNMAVSPGIILVPSNMVILAKPIPGYNNTLTSATLHMSFGVNSELNYDEKSNGCDKKQHQPDKPTKHLNSLSGSQTPCNKKKPGESDPSGEDLDMLSLFGATGLVSFLVLKYAL